MRCGPVLASITATCELQLGSLLRRVVRALPGRNADDGRCAASPVPPITGSYW